MKKIFYIVTIILVSIFIFYLYIYKIQTNIETFKQKDTDKYNLGYSCQFYFSDKDRYDQNGFLNKIIIAGDDINNHIFLMFIDNKLREFKKIDNKWIADNFELVINEKTNVLRDKFSDYYEMSGTFTVKNNWSGNIVTKDYVGFCSP